MRKLDLKWMDDRWSPFDDNGNCVLNDDAPQEAKESYTHYLEQRKRIAAESDKYMD